jgi:hypothetical protein
VLDPPNEVTNAIIGAVNGLYRPLETLWARRNGHAKKKRGLSGLFARNFRKGNDQ